MTGLNFRNDGFRIYPYPSASTASQSPSTSRSASVGTGTHISAVYSGIEGDTTYVVSSEGKSYFVSADDILQHVSVDQLEFFENRRFYNERKRDQKLVTVKREASKVYKRQKFTRKPRKAAIDNSEDTASPAENGRQGVTSTNGLLTTGPIASQRPENTTDEVGSTQDNESLEIAETSDDDSAFEIEAVVSKRTVYGEKEYMIKWKGWCPAFNEWLSSDKLRGEHDIAVQYERSIAHTQIDPTPIEAQTDNLMENVPRRQNREVPTHENCLDASVKRAPEFRGGPDLAESCIDKELKKKPTWSTTKLTQHQMCMILGAREWTSSTNAAAENQGYSYRSVTPDTQEGSNPSEPRFSPDHELTPKSYSLALLTPNLRDEDRSNNDLSIRRQEDVTSATSPAICKDRKRKRRPKQSQQKKRSTTKYEHVPIIWYLEKILDHRERIVQGEKKLEFFIKWKNHSVKKCTWENEKDLSDAENVISDYFKNIK